MRRILVLRGGALGDFIVTLPALHLLRRTWPAARIELVGNRTAGALGLSAALIDAVHSQNESSWATLFGPEPLPPDLASWLRDFDLILCFWPDPDGVLDARLPLRSEQHFLTATPHPHRSPAAAHYCAPLAALGLQPDRLHVPLQPRPALPAGAPPRVAIHPGSGSPRKNWPSERWIVMASWLEAAFGAELLVIAGEAEPSGILSGQGRRLQNRPLPELMSELLTCSLYLGHDSGISHLAAALMVPSILLFGPTDPEIWSPPAPHVQVLRSGPKLEAIDVSALQSIVSEVLAPRP